jgi:5-hydroxyisourate hydrolase-like protein (transthyretin family)
MTSRILFIAALALVMLAVGFGQVVTPPVPTNLTAMLTTDATPAVKLAWGVPSGTWGFLVYRSVDDSLHFGKLAMVNSTVYVDHTVKAGHIYFYYVSSLGMNTSSTPAQSGPSNIAWVSIGGTTERPVGMIAGKVTDDSTGKPIAGVRILFSPLRPMIMTTIVMPSTVTDSLGAYTMKLDTGAYKVHAEPAPWMPPSPPPYIPEWYNNKKDYQSADPVQVSANASTEANFGLSRVLIPTVPKGTITGKIVDATTGNPLAGMMVRSFRKSNSVTRVMPVAVTDSLGIYSMKVDTGTYLLKTESLRMSAIDYIMEWYDNVTDATKATPVAVADGATVTANFDLAKPVPPVYATVEGTVTDTLGNPLRRATVVIMRSLSAQASTSALALVSNGHDGDRGDVEGIGYCRGMFWKGTTDSAGHYKATLIQDTTYIAMAAKWGYLPEYYNNQPTPLLADIIKVTGNVTGIDFSLAPNPMVQNSISGLVQDSAGTGVPSIIVLFPSPKSPSLGHPRVAHTDSTGAYTIGNVRTGKYFVLAVPFGKYAPAFFKAGAYGVMHMANADTVLVSGDVSGIDIGVVPVNSVGITRLRGRILANGKPVAGARVLASTGSTVLGNGLTDAKGVYVIEAVPAGAMTLTVDATGYTGADQNVTIAASTFEVSNGDISLQSIATDVAEAATTPSTFALHQNYPNPFNPSTTIAFDMPVAGQVKLVVYNMLGQEVATLMNGTMASGRASIVWNATDRSGIGVASGVYFYQLTVNGADGHTAYRSVQKMLLVR